MKKPLYPTAYLVAKLKIAWGKVVILRVIIFHTVQEKATGNI